MPPETFAVGAPLIDFDWSGASFNFGDVLITTDKPTLRGLERDWLVAPERNSLVQTRHWATFTQVEGEDPSAGVRLNLLLLALWLVRPTRTRIKLYFKVNTDSTSQNLGQMKRVHTQFNFIPGHVSSGFSDRDLSRASRYYKVMLQLAASRGRLYQALVLNLEGCWSHAWHVSFICHGAASEAILTYSRDPGITKRLATAFAVLTRRSAAQRDRAYSRFVDAYDTRSDIMHGRIHNVPAGEKLRRLASIERMSREMWRILFNSATLRTTLDGDDGRRQAHFQRLQGTYRPQR